MKKYLLSAVFVSILSFNAEAMAQTADSANGESEYRETSLQMLLDSQMAEETVAQAQPEAEPTRPEITYNQEKFDYFLENQGGEIANDPVIAGAIMQQNERHKNLSRGQILALDNQWQSGDQSLIEPTMDNVLSNRLQRYVKNYDGVFTEMFVMDNKGLNVGASFMTSDYWQGDEEKFTEAYNNGQGAVHVEQAEFDESMGIVQIMTGLPVRHYLTGEVIGTIAMAINPEEIKR